MAAEDGAGACASMVYAPPPVEACSAVASAAQRAGPQTLGGGNMPCSWNVCCILVQRCSGHMMAMSGVSAASVVPGRW